ncbi:hypothetical protein ELH91_07925 [Rhizobium leguminosarum]|uniref:hypothetical protein n=1 Tax=Rhizobium leguminosarum TaxID=384 RepID=UPI001030FA50|nr:hypothetical protein [Rhizobium leguminosarum]TAY16707.1 hypothetical protein ELH91_07925 [Rhizobium leguminosarum]
MKTYQHIADTYEHKKELEEAMGRSFEAKLKFARIEAQMTEEQARTITTMHTFRNELYHLGLQHEPILPSLALFYFATACDFIGGFKILGFSYSWNIVLPERAQKYFTRDGRFSPAEPDDFPNACRKLEEACQHKKSVTIASLADHMDSVISDSDTCLDVLAHLIYDNQRRTRDEAIIDCQTWRLAFETEGTDFAKKGGWRGGTFFDLVEWLKRNYPLQFKKDPIPSWKKQALRMRSNWNPHVALANYQSFMTVTGPMREALLEGATQVEAEIDRLVDERRGN